MITLLFSVPDYVAHHAIGVVWVAWLIAAVGSLVTITAAGYAKKPVCLHHSAGCH